ncbi:unnamed protein product [Caenorhabditis brenneri]
MIFVASRRSLSTSPMPPPLPRHQPPLPKVDFIMEPPYPSCSQRRVPAWCNMTSDERQEHKKQLEALRLREHMKELRRNPEQQLLLTSSSSSSGSTPAPHPRVIVFDYEKKIKKSSEDESPDEKENHSLVLNQMPTRLDIVGNLKFSSSTDIGDDGTGEDDDTGDVTACFVLPSPSSFSKLTILDDHDDEEDCKCIRMALLVLLASFGIRTDFD